MISDRERIARDLHDIVIQRLFATGLQLQGVAVMAGDGAVADRLDQSVADARRHDQGHPRHDLRAAGPRRRLAARRVRGLVQEYVPVLGFSPVVRTSGPVDTVVPPALGAQLLAVLREAISNVARHALAESAEVEVAVERRPARAAGRRRRRRAAGRGLRERAAQRPASRRRPRRHPRGVAARPGAAPCWCGASRSAEPERRQDAGRPDAGDWRRVLCAGACCHRRTGCFSTTSVRFHQ